MPCPKYSCIYYHLISLHNLKWETAEMHLFLWLHSVFESVDTILFTVFVPKLKAGAHWGYGRLLLPMLLTYVWNVFLCSSYPLGTLNNLRRIGRVSSHFKCIWWWDALTQPRSRLYAENTSTYSINRAFRSAFSASVNPSDGQWQLYRWTKCPDSTCDDAFACVSLLTSVSFHYSPVRASLTLM